MLSPTQYVMRRAALNAALKIARANNDICRIRAALGQLTWLLELEYGKPEYAALTKPPEDRP